MENTDQHQLTTLSKRSDDLLQQGFKEQFVMTPSGLKSCSTEKVFQPEEVKILKHYRFEGDTDPADMSILYALETNDGLKGTVADAYGPSSDSEFSEFIKTVEELANRNNPGARQQE